MSTIPVFFTFNRNYLLAAQVAIYSMLKHASRAFEYKLYILHTDLTAAHQAQLFKTVQKFPAVLHFIDVSSYNEDINQLGGKAHYSKEIFYKLIAADMFPQYDRIICTDVDVVFTGDISPSYFLYPDEFFYFAGVGPIENSRMPLYQGKFTDEEVAILEHEIAAGYLLINLKAIRESNKQLDMTKFYVENYKRLLLPEQDCIILTCWPHIKYLPLNYSLPIAFYKFNMHARSFYQGNTEFAGDKVAALNKFQHALAQPVQIHYAGFDKPWNSFFITKWKAWTSMMLEAGYLGTYLKMLPYFLLRRLKRYSLKRFLRKLYRRITNHHKE